MGKGEKKSGAEEVQGSKKKKITAAGGQKIRKQGTKRRMKKCGTR
jgi:hypothetical protein